MSSQRVPLGLRPSYGLALAGTQAGNAAAGGWAGEVALQTLAFGVVFPVRARDLLGLLQREVRLQCLRDEQVQACATATESQKCAVLNAPRVHFSRRRRVYHLVLSTPHARGTPEQVLGSWGRIGAEEEGSTGPRTHCSTRARAGLLRRQQDTRERCKAQRRGQNSLVGGG